MNQHHEVREASAEYLAAGELVSVGYKKTDVGVIPADWDVVSIDIALGRKLILDQMDGNHGELYPKSHEFSDSGVPYVGATDFCTGNIDFHGCKYLPLERAKKFKKGIALNDDVLFAHNATVGPVALVSCEFDFVILSTTATYYRCNAEKLNNYYLKSYFESIYFVGQYVPIMAQSTRNQVPILAQRKLLLVLPSLKEQTAIANALADVDALINSLEKLITKKQAIKTATMQQLLTGKTRLPQFATRGDGSKKGYKQSELGEIPEDWGVTQFSSVLKIRHGRNQKEVESIDGEFPIFATGGEIGRANTPLYRKPSVLIGRKGTIDKPRFADSPFWTVDTLFYSEIIDSAEPKFVFYKFCMINWMGYNEASGVPSLNASTIESVQVALPAKSEQGAIATILSDIDTEIETLQQRLDKTRQIKQGMMQELLTGKTRLIKPQAQGNKK